MTDKQKRHLLMTLLVVMTISWMRPMTEEPYDFCSYYTAGLLALEGEPERAYSNVEIRTRHYQAHGIQKRIGAFLYSPVLLFPCAALASLPSGAAELANHILTLLSLGIILFLMLESARGPLLEIAFCLVLLLSHLVMVQFLYRNWSFLLVALIALAWYLSSKGRSLAASVCWGAAIHLKVFAALFVVPLVVGGRRRLAGMVVGVTVLMALLTLPFFGFDVWGTFARMMRELSAWGVTPFYNKISLQATIGRFLTEPMEWFKPQGPVTHPLVRWLLPASLPFYLGLIWWRRKDWSWGVAVTIPYLLLFNPQTWEHTELLLLLVLPVLGTRAAILLSVLLCAGVFYRDAILAQALYVVRDGDSGQLLRLVLLYYPLLNVIALVSLVLQALRGESVPVSDAVEA